MYRLGIRDSVLANRLIGDWPFFLELCDRQAQPQAIPKLALRIRHPQQASAGVLTPRRVLKGLDQCKRLPVGSRRTTDSTAFR